MKRSSDDVADHTDDQPMTPPRTDIDDLVIVSNREPFSHTYRDGDVSVTHPPGGLTMALDDVADSLGGTWVAWGSGDADFDPAVVDERNVVRDGQVARDYTLRRVRLTTDQVEGYYYGYSNQALWPLCHIETAHTRFDGADWEQYRRVNERFADAVASVGGENVWIHDYHLTLLPRYLRDRIGSEPTLVQFWHIPWPSPEVFEICPQREAILRGLLANDAVGFHIERFRRHFLDCAETLLDDARVDRATGTVRLGGESTHTYVVPVGVDLDSMRRTLRELPRTVSAPIPDRCESTGTLAVGVDRLDYTKGIVERLDALDRALATTPALRGELVYLQIASKSRERIPSYRRYHRTVLERIDDLNGTYGTADWQPVVYTDETLSRGAILRTLERADVCIVSSRRDGLNLIAEEFVAASRDAPGELLVSEFAGVAEVLGPAATRINPFDTDGFATAIVEAVATSDAERRRHVAALVDDLQDASLDDWIRRHIDLFDGR